MRWFEWFWAGWAAIALVVELFVLFLGIKGATLSEQIWKLRDTGSGWFSLLMFFMAWMIYHFIRENIGGSPELPPEGIVPPLEPGPEVPPP